MSFWWRTSQISQLWLKRKKSFPPFSGFQVQGCADYTILSVSLSGSRCAVSKHKMEIKKMFHSRWILIKRTSQTFIHSLIPPHVQPHIFMYTCWVYVIILSVSSFKLRSAKNIPAFLLNAYNLACYWFFLFHYWEESNWLIFAKSKSTYFYKAPKPQDPSSVLCDSV